jgi:hypothetical protein
LNRLPVEIHRNGQRHHRGPRQLQNVTTPEYTEYMPSLTIREIPEDTLKQMRRAAKEQRRSLNSQALVWLEQCAKQMRTVEQRRELFEAIRATKASILRRHGRGGDSVELIRAMRRRGQA